MNLRVQIRAAVLELLNTDRPAGVPVARRRLWQRGEDDPLPTIGLFTAAEENATGGGRHGPVTTRVLTLGVQYKIGVKTLDAGEDALEPMLGWCVERLGDTNLGGLIHDTFEVSTTWGQDNLDLLYVTAVQQWALRYQSLRADLTRRQ